jgi:hypothetical protein
MSLLKAHVRRSFIICTLHQCDYYQTDDRERMNCAVPVAHIGDMTNAYKILRGKPEGIKKP